MKTTLKIFFTILWLVSSVGNVFAQTDKTVGELTDKIDKTVLEIDAFWKKHKDKQKEYVIKEHNDELVLEEVQKNFDYKETEASYILLNDDRGRLLSHAEVPTSISGDWYRERTHYFDNDGRTIMYKDFSYHYNSGCTYELNVTTRYYFDPQFHVIMQRTEYTDKDGKPIADPAKCEQYGSDETNEEVMRPDYAAIQKRIERNLIKYKKRRIEKARIQKEGNEKRAGQRLRQEKDDEEYDRQVQREHIKDIIRTTLYTISAISILTAILLLIRKKIKRNKTEGS